ncbi:MAG: hypothetical protein KGL62_11645 [Bradyrhizobium sp.]|uniref:hypothetical protein n=1 Tax=Bradyrhizobium sp. TaxID=376 RepID=UPI002397F666|nr:hypothetical protein [Bradyrhizobium sp.]MDE2603006.1 hypothetical protein [Bradyrhizobium sp.]
MHWRSRSRIIAVGGLCLAAMVTTGAPAHAQAMQVVGAGPTDSSATGSGAADTNATFNPYDPQWTLAAPFGFNTASGMAPGIDRQAYTMKLGSGTVGLFAASNTQDDGARAMGSTGNFFDPLPFSPVLPHADWFGVLGDSAWRSSLVGTYKSNPNEALFNGLYTTASFGVTSFKTGPAGLPGLTNFTSGNEATALTTTAGVGYQITPQLSIEGSVSFTQMQGSNFR